MTQSVRAPVQLEKDSGFESRCWQEFFRFVILLTSRSSQLESVNTNEINRDKHLVYTLFKLENSMYLLVQFSFNKRNIIIWYNNENIYLFHFFPGMVQVSTNTVPEIWRGHPQPKPRDHFRLHQTTQR